MTRRRAVLISALLAAIAGCSGGSSATSTTPTTPAPSSTAATTTTTSTTVAPTTTTTTVLSSKDVLAKVGPSIVYIETPLGSGSGVLLADGYVLTNLHVVDPFRTVTLRFPDIADAIENVPVVGIDDGTDVALVGPVKVDRSALDLADPADLAKGDQLYLIGYPGETSKKPDVTISQGILSRIRVLDDYHLTYLQTDAAIGGGQSGGALVDARGRVVGISGLSFADSFALALSGPDAKKSVDKIRSGAGTQYETIPEATLKSAVFDLVDDTDERLFALYSGATQTTFKLRLTKGSRPLFAVVDASGEPLFVSKATLNYYLQLAGTGIGEIPFPTLGDSVIELSPTLFQFTLPADRYVFLDFRTGRTAGDHIALTSESALGDVSFRDGRVPVSIGGTVAGSISVVDPHKSYVVDLVKGQPVTITAASPASNMAFEVLAPGTSEFGAFSVDDSELGLYGLDAQGVFTPKVTGKFKILVFSGGGNSTSFSLKVEAGDTTVKKGGSDTTTTVAVPTTT